VQVASVVVGIEMATKTTVVLEDDLEGGPAAETVRISAAGTEYEIDLNKKNAAAFHRKLAPFIEHAHRAGRGPRLAAPGVRKPSVPHQHLTQSIRQDPGSGEAGPGS
jgi:nucleoid-associated protein Lsr2